MKGLGFYFKKYKNKRYVSIKRDDGAARPAKYISELKEIMRKGLRSRMYTEMRPAFHTNWAVNECRQKDTVLRVILHSCAKQIAIVFHAGEGKGL